MELYGNTMENLHSSLSIQTCKDKIESYANGIELYSNVTTDNGVEITNYIFEKYSLRNANFITIYMNMVAENDKGTEIFFSLKERQEGLLNFSFGKKQKLIKEITELLS